MTGSRPPLDDRSPIAVALEKATEITTVAFVMVLPVLLGYWLDLYLNSVPLCAVIGLVLGMSTGIRQLIKLVNRQSPGDSMRSGEHPGSRPDNGHSGDR